LVALTSFTAMRQKPVRAWIEHRVRWDTVERVQRLLRCKQLDVWFSSFPFLGNEIQYVLLLPFFSWFFGDGGVMVRHFSLAAFVACYYSNTVKCQMRLPRPPLRLHVGKGDSVSKTAQQEHERIAEQFGFPSTHSAHAVVLGSVVARACLGSGAEQLAFVLAHTAHVVTSRLYMGVHSLADVVCGMSIGLLLALGGFAPLATLTDAFAADGGAETLGLYAAGLMGVLALFPDKRGSTYEETVSFAGVHLGLFWASRTAAWGLPATPAASTSLAACVLEYVAGLVTLGVLRTAASAAAKKAIKAVVPAGRLVGIFTIIRVLLVNLAASWYVMAIHPSNVVGAFM